MERDRRSICKVFQIWKGRVWGDPIACAPVYSDPLSWSKVTDEDWGRPHARCNLYVPRRKICERIVQRYPDIGERVREGGGGAFGEQRTYDV